MEFCGLTGDVVELGESFDVHSAFWSPELLAPLNGYAVAPLRFKGELSGPVRDDTDEFFLVLDGRLTLRLRD